MEIYIRQQSRYKFFILPLMIYSFTEEVNNVVEGLAVWITRPFSTKTPAPSILPTTNAIAVKMLSSPRRVPSTTVC